MDKRSAEPAPSVIPAPPADLILRPEMVAAVRLNAIQIESHAYWCRLIRVKIAPLYVRYFPPDPKKSEETVRKGHLDKLLDFSEFAGISDMWRRSAFVSDAELKAAGGKKERPFTRQSFSRQLADLAANTGEAGDMSLFEGRSKRVIDAMLCHQLLEELPGRPNLIPLQVTANLNALMAAYHTNLGLLWAGALGDPADTSKRPEGGDHA